MESLKISDYMNKRPAKFTLEMSVAEAVEKLLDTHQTGGPVVTEQGQLVGFLSEQDCLTRMLESSYYRQQVARVKDIMKTEVLSVNSYDSVLELAQRMLGEKPKVYPVIDEEGFLQGTINRTDVLRAIDIQLRDGYPK
ncbi:CBS domain-containing protein [Glaciecola sp. 1036]|uniref:CBS domain-containing protein n=1 Tax=Alteromonadaceae TaxID=72275 RepID=UPI003D0867B8